MHISLATLPTDAHDQFRQWLRVKIADVTRSARKLSSDRGMQTMWKAADINQLTEKGKSNDAAEKLATRFHKLRYPNSA